MTFGYEELLATDDDEVALIAREKTNLVSAIFITKKHGTNLLFCDQRLLNELTRRTTHLH